VWTRGDGTDGVVDHDVPLLFDEAAEEPGVHGWVESSIERAIRMTPARR
jgi:hypothetical protein